MNYDDSVLIKLHRDYKKDEVVMFALKKIKELKVENSKKEAFIFELTKRLSDFKADLRNGKNVEKSNEKYILEINKLKEALSKRNSEIKEKNKLIAKLKT